MTDDETRPILREPVSVQLQAEASQPLNVVGQQHVIIQPIEFNHKHRNLYGYFSLVAGVLVLISYLMIQERTCQLSLVNGFKNFDLLQSFHMTALIVAILMFVLSYFNIAVAIYDFKLLFYATNLLIFLSAGVLVYNAIAITTAPCNPSIGDVLVQKLFQTITATNTEAKNIFAAGDGIGIAVFVLDLIAASLLFLAGRSFYHRS